MPVLLTTDSVAPPQRVDYWQNCLQQQFGIDWRIEPRRGTPFSANMALSAVGPLLLSEHWGSSVSAWHGGAADDALFIRLQLQGQSSLRCRGREALLLPGEFCLYAAQDAADLQFCSGSGDGHWRCLVVQLPGRHLGARFPGWERHLATSIGSGGGAAALFVAALNSLLEHGELLQGAEAHHVAESTIGLLAAVLAALGDGDHASSPRMETYHRERIKEFVRTHLCDPGLDVAAIAQAVGLSPGHIHRIFAREELPLMQWVWTERLQHCYRELATERPRAGRSISSIAYGWGFNDAAHFSRSFRKRFGLSPSEVRVGQSAAQRHPRNLEGARQRQEMRQLGSN